MAFIKKTWKNRISEFPTRRVLTHTDGTEETVMVTRSEGTVSQEGDAFSDENMNGLEDRIAEAFGGDGSLTLGFTEDGDPGFRVGADSVVPFSSGGEIEDSVIVSKNNGFYGGSDINGATKNIDIEYEISEKGIAFVVAKTITGGWYGGIAVSDFSIKLNDEVIGLEQNMMYQLKVEAGDIIKAHVRLKATGSGTHISYGVLEMAVSKAKNSSEKKPGIENGNDMNF